MGRKKLPSGLDEHLGYWLRYVSNHVSHAFTLKVEAHGVTVAEWVVMRSLLETGPAQPSHLADELGMTRGAISKLVERLCQKGFVERNSGGEDRRRQIVALSTAGQRLVPTLAQLADENDQEHFGFLGKRERLMLVELLQAVVRQHGWKDVPVN